MHNFIPISKPCISDLEVEYVTDAVKSTWVSSLGKYIDRFEEEFAAYCQCNYAVSVSNGTVAIQLALVALGIGEGDEVIVPDLSFIATANAVLHAGAKPIFIDIDPVSLCMNPDLIESAITSKTRAIMPVHLYGHPADMNRINQIAEKFGLLVIEDAAESHGATLQGKRVGSFGHCATFSFYGNKIITTGEGGMITMQDRDLYEKCKFLRDHAMSKEKRYWHTELGYNFRITNLQAALGCAQMQKIDQFISRRKEIFNSYQELLGNHNGVQLNRTVEDASNAYWLICVELEGIGADRKTTLMKDLKDKGIDSRPYFYPMSHMPYFTKANTPVSAIKSEIGLNLPTFTDITGEEIERISKGLLELL